MKSEHGGRARRVALAGLLGGLLVGGVAWWLAPEDRGATEPPPRAAEAEVAAPAASARPALDGEVTDRERRRPLAGAQVTVSCGEGPPVVAETDAEGRFAVDALPAGECSVSAAKAGYVAGGPTTGRPQAVQIAAGATATVSVALSETVTVVGRVEGGTGPPDEVRLSVLYVEAGGEPESFHVEVGARPDSGGGFELRDLLPGELQVLAEPPEDGLGESEVLVLAPGTTRRGVVVHLGETARLEGRVSAADDGQPVEGAIVRVYAAGASVAARTATDAHGRYALERLGPGAALATVSARGFVTRSHLPVELLAGDTTELPVELETAPGFSGQVLGPDGQPVVGASIYVQSTTAVPEGVGGRRIATTRTEGRFLVERPLVWPIFVQAAHPELGASPWTRVEGPGEDVTLRLGGGSGLVGRVVDARGRAIEGVRLAATSGGHRRSSGPAGQGVADPRDGRFHLPVARPGTWSVLAGAPGYAPAESARVEVPAGRLVDVGTLVLRPGAQVVGQVLDATTREPLAGAQVAAQGSDARGPSGQGGGTTTGSDGRFVLDELPVRRMSIHVRAAGHRMRLLTGVEPRPGEVTDVGLVLLADDGGSRGGMDYGGIGAALRIQDGAITLASVFGGSAAEAAGLTKGTRILSIDGQDATSMGMQQALELLRGDPGSDVSVEVMKPGAATVERVRLMRREVSAD
ncbi:MAG: carboxypeptidase regulatory-like domain-containing protein [Deltaproteobacteria bacterium]|nr:carboxypeptidase regulatory-like domain-containing protein [Deltaproteobacteria bacterium]